MLGKDNVDNIIDVILSDEKLCTHIVSLVLKRLPNDRKTRQDHNLCEKVVDYTIDQALQEINIKELLQILLQQAALKRKRQAIIEQRQRQVEKIQNERAKQQSQNRSPINHQQRGQQQRLPQNYQEDLSNGHGTPRRGSVGSDSSDKLRPTFSPSEPQKASPTAPRRLVQQLRKKAPLPSHMQHHSSEDVPRGSSNAVSDTSPPLQQPNYSESPSISVDMQKQQQQEQPQQGLSNRLNKTAPAKIMEPKGSTQPSRARPSLPERQLSMNSGLGSTVDSEASTIPMGMRASGGGLLTSDSSQDWLFQDFRSASSMSTHFEEGDMYERGATPQPLQPLQPSPTRISPHMGVAMDELPQAAHPTSRISDEDDDPTTFSLERADSSRLLNKDTSGFDDSDFMLAYSKEDSADADTRPDDAADSPPTAAAPIPKGAGEREDPFNQTIRDPHTLRNALSSDEIAEADARADSAAAVDADADSEKRGRNEQQTEDLLRDWENQVMKGLRSGDEEEGAVVGGDGFSKQEQVLFDEQSEGRDDNASSEPSKTDVHADEATVTTKMQNGATAARDDSEASDRAMARSASSDKEQGSARDGPYAAEDDAGYGDDLGMNNINDFEDDDGYNDSKQAEITAEEGGDDFEHSDDDDDDAEGDGDTDKFNREGGAKYSGNFMTNDTAESYSTGIRSTGVAQKLLFFDQDKFDDFVDKQDKESGSDADASKKRKPKRRVSFPDDVVAEVYFREKVAVSERNQLFYSHMEEEQFMRQQGMETNRAEALGMTWMEYMEHRSDEDAEREDDEGVAVEHDDEEEEEFQYTGDFYESMDDEDELAALKNLSAGAGAGADAGAGESNRLGMEEYEDEFEDSVGDNSSGMLREEQQQHQRQQQYSDQSSVEHDEADTCNGHKRRSQYGNELSPSERAVQQASDDFSGPSYHSEDDDSYGF